MGAGEVEFATPNATNALHRLGVYASTEGKTLREVGTARARGGAIARIRAYPRWRRSTAPATWQSSFTACRSSSDGLVTGVVVLVARRVGPSSTQSVGAEQGGRRSRGPPPREEQPADDLVAAAPAGATQRRDRDASWRCRRRSGACARSRSCTRCSRANPAKRWSSTRSSAPRPARRGHGAGPAPRRDRGERRAGHVCRPTWRRRSRWRSTELLTNAVEHAFIDFGGPDNEHVGVVTLNLSLRG